MEPVSFIGCNKTSKLIVTNKIYCYDDKFKIIII